MYFIYVFVQLVKVKIATKSRFGRNHSVDFDAEKFQHGFEDSNTHNSMVDTGVSTSTSIQSYGAAYEEQRKEHMAATRIQTAFRGFLVSITFFAPINFIYICLKRYFMVSLVSVA